MARTTSTKASRAPLEDLVNRLTLFNEKDELSEIVATSNQILAQSPNDSQTANTLIHAYIRHEKYLDLCNFIKSSSFESQDYILEYSYALYKLGRHDEVVALIGNRKDRGLLHVLAQSYYRTGNFFQARRIYSQYILTTPNQVEHEAYDLSVNERAILAQLNLTASIQHDSAIPSSSNETYDQLFNNSLILISENKYTEALTLLTRAKALCQTTEHLSPEGLAGELSPILIQAAYVNILLKNYDVASNILNTIDLKNLNDSALLYLTHSLKLVLSSASDENSEYRNPHKALAFLDEAGVYNSLKSNYVPLQQQILSDNRFLLELAAGKSQKNLLRAQAKTEFPVSKSIEGYSFFKSVQDLAPKDQLKNLNKQYAQKKENVALAFTIAQIHANQGEYSLASAAIVEYVNAVEKKSPKDAYAPGVISALAGLNSLTGKRTGKFIQFLDNAVNFWSRDSSVDSDPSFQYLFSDAGIALSGTGKDALIKSKLEKLYEQDPSNVTVIAGLLGLGDTQVTEKYADKETTLLPVSEILTGIDVDALASAGLEPLIKKRKFSEVESANSESSVKRKHKKAKLPQNYSSDKQPDPERWIPLRDRSTYKPPKAKGKKKPLASTQGGAVDESLSITSGTHTPPTGAPVVKANKPKNIKKNKKKGKK